MAERDKSRHVPAEGQPKKRKRIRGPPKRVASPFFYFLDEERPGLRQEFPTMSHLQILKELAKRWEACEYKGKFEALNLRDKQQYDRDMRSYHRYGYYVVPDEASGSASPKKAKLEPEPTQIIPEAAAVVEEEEEEED